MTRVGSAELERRRSIVERWRRSGQSAAVYSKRCGMSQWKLFAWAKKCDTRSEGRRGAAGLTASGGKQRGRRAKVSRHVDLIPVRLLTEDGIGSQRGLTPPVAAEGVIEIRLRSGEVVRLVGEVPLERVRSVLTAVRQTC
jgi:hypothetical protein